MEDLMLDMCSNTYLIKYTAYKFVFNLFLRVLSMYFCFKIHVLAV